MLFFKKLWNVARNCKLGNIHQEINSFSHGVTYNRRGEGENNNILDVSNKSCMEVEEVKFALNLTPSGIIELAGTEIKRLSRVELGSNYGSFKVWQVVTFANLTYGLLTANSNSSTT